MSEVSIRERVVSRANETRSYEIDFEVSNHANKESVCEHQSMFGNKCWMRSPHSLIGRPLGDIKTRGPRIRWTGS
jgi:hypothetical protein